MSKNWIKLPDFLRDRDTTRKPAVKVQQGQVKHHEPQTWAPTVEQPRKPATPEKQPHDDTGLQDTVITGSAGRHEGS